MDLKVVKLSDKFDKPTVSELIDKLESKLISMIDNTYS